MTTTRKRKRSAQAATYTTLDKFFGTKAPGQAWVPPLKLRKTEDKTPSLHKFFKPSEHRLTAISDSIQSNLEAMTPSSTVIAYRPDGDGKGPYFDHYAMQLISKAPTVIAAPPRQTFSNFGHYHKTVTHKLPFVNTSHDEKFSLPPALDEHSKTGLLYIPGVSQSEYKKPEYQKRVEHERRLIKDAINKGQPILAVCGGSWVLWQYFGGDIVEVKDHNYRGGMPRILDTNGKIGHNVQVHRISIPTHAYLLRGALALNANNTENLPVNSVHSFAADGSKVPEQLIVSATTVQDNELAPINAHSATKQKLQPQDKSVEAFEAKFGAPVMGVEWHPEAYLGPSKKQDNYGIHQQHLVNYMYKAGQTYLNRQKVNAELISQFSVVKSNLKQTNLIRDDQIARKHVTKHALSFSYFTTSKKTSLRHIRELTQEIIWKEQYLLEKKHRIRG